jgi:two-component system, OmpR family, sensor histidine kinase KdpD
MPIQRASCDLHQVVREVITTLSSLFKDNPVVVEVQSADPTIECDPSLLHRVIGNLLSNAAKFSPRTEPITISFHNFPGFLKVTVRDEGRGIPPEYHARKIIPNH